MRNFLRKINDIVTNASTACCSLTVSKFSISLKSSSEDYLCGRVFPAVEMELHVDVDLHLVVRREWKRLSHDAVQNETPFE